MPETFKNVQPTSQAAYQRLADGNARFVIGHSNQCQYETINRREMLKEGQAPFAIILGCSDSRVPAEIVFDQSLGDLFVIRIAGNIVAPSQIGSIEFAVERYGSPLVVVLGHTKCGAITATVEALTSPSNVKSQCAHIGSIVKRIEPSVTELLKSNLTHDPEALVSSACKANIRASVNHLRHSSEFIEQMLDKKKLDIIGAEYDLDTGVVTFFEH